MKKVIECVPNFSEGKDKDKIDKIISEIQTVRGVFVLNKDMGLAANRTVITFAGEPQNVVEAAFRAIKKAAALIDMREQKGVHPRIGATDVCPLVPVLGITMEETIVFARQLAERVGQELNIPVYCYEFAALKEERINLAYIRKGQYEGLPEKLQTKDGYPDFGPAHFNSKAGAVAIGARDFLIAYNIDLQTTSAAIARKIATKIREKGQVKSDENGNVVLNKKGIPEFAFNGLKAVKAIGWYIEEYGNAQVSVNITNFRLTPLHIVFERVKAEAGKLNVNVKGSEIIGLVPVAVLEAAGKYYTRDNSMPRELLIETAILKLGLNVRSPFSLKEKVLEYILATTKI